MYQGIISVGQQFIWEPKHPRSFEHITVTDITENQDGELQIKSENAKGVRFWNSEDRFREAVLPKYLSQ